jgi:hypothetical protein
MDNSGIVVKYIRLYFNNTITKCVTDAIQASQLFLGVSGKARSCLLAVAVQSW